MYYLIVCIGNLRLADHIFKHKTVLYLRHTENSVVASIGLCHLTDDTGHIVLLLVVFGLCPLVLAVRKELLVILGRIIIDVKQVLKVVKTYHIIP